MKRVGRSRYGIALALALAVVTPGASLAASTGNDTKTEHWTKSSSDSRWVGGALTVYWSSKKCVNTFGATETHWKMTSWKLSFTRSSTNKYGSVRFSAHYGMIGGFVCQGESQGSVDALWTNQLVAWPTTTTSTAYSVATPSNWPWYSTNGVTPSINVNVGLKLGWQPPPGNPTTYTRECITNAVPGFFDPEDCSVYPS